MIRTYKNHHIKYQSRNFRHQADFKQIKDFRPGDHLCVIYETEQEHCDLLTPFLHHGLERNEKVVYIVDTHTAESVIAYLRDNGLDVQQYLKNGQLVMLTRDDAYMRSGTFDPDGMIQLLRHETDKAISEGYNALRLTGEMSWALRGLPGSERVIEYENKLNEFFPGNPCLAICQYDRRQFDADILLDVLRTHPFAILGTHIYENFYYIPPEKLSGEDPSSKELNNWVQNLQNHRKYQQALSESEERYRELFANMRSALAVYQAVDDGKDFVFMDFNKAAEKTENVNRDDILGRSVLDVFPGVKDFGLFDVFQRVWNTGKPEHHPVSFYKDERIAGWRENYVYRLPSGEIVAIYDDITERKKAEQEREKLFHDMGERIKELNCIYKISELARKKDTIEEILQHTADILPPSWHYPEIARGKVIFDREEYVSSPFKETEWKQSSAIIVNGKNRGSIEVYYLEKCPELDEGPFLKEERDLIERIAIIISQVIEYKVAEEQINKSRLRYQKLFTEALTPIILVDPELYIIEEANPKTLELTGFNQDELVGAHFSKLMLEDRKKIEEKLEKPAGGEGLRVTMKTMMTKSGEKKFIDAVFSYYYEYEDKPLIQVIMQDVTGRKKAEEQLKRLNAELVSKNKELEQILYATSHDLRSPLVNIQGFGNELEASFLELKSFLEDKNVPDEIRNRFTPIIRDEIPESLQFIQRSISKMDRLLSGLLQLSRLGRKELKIETLNMNQLVTDVINTLNFKIREKGIKIKVDHLPPCKGDETQINQVFSNLLDNAIKFMSPERQGYIHISGNDRGDHAEYVIRDNGIGMSPEHQEQIFELFHQLYPSESGEGLGLTIVRRVLDRLGGTIQVESKKDVGTTFTVCLPR